MFDRPDGITLAKYLQEHTAGRVVKGVLPPSRQHVFCLYSGDPASYDPALRDSKITRVESQGLFMELHFDNGCRLRFNDGVNLLLTKREQEPDYYQLLIRLDRGESLIFTVHVCGAILLYSGIPHQEGGKESSQTPPPLSPVFNQLCNGSQEKEKIFRYITTGKDGRSTGKE